MPALGELIKSLRVARGLSQDELGVRVGASQRHLSFLETGRAAPSRELILRIVIELGVSYADTVRLLKAAGYSVSAKPPLPKDEEVPAGFKKFADRLVASNPGVPALLTDERLRIVRMNGSMAGLLSMLGSVDEFFEGAYVSFPICVLHPGGLCAMLTRPEQGAADFLQYLLRRKLKDPATLEPIIRRAMDFPLAAQSPGRIEPSAFSAREGYELSGPFRNIRVRPTVVETDNPVGHNRDYIPKLSLWTAIAADERSKRIMANWARIARRNIHEWLKPFWTGADGNDR